MPSKFSREAPKDTPNRRQTKAKSKNWAPGAWRGRTSLRPRSFSLKMARFLVSPGTPKSTQNRLLGQKLAPQADFLDIFWPFLRLSWFFDVWRSIFHDFSMVFSMNFSMSASVFCKSPNLRIYWQGQYFQLFSRFLFFVFFLKMIKKATKTVAQKKHRKSTFRGSVLGPKLAKN